MASALASAIDLMERPVAPLLLMIISPAVTQTDIHVNGLMTAWLRPAGGLALLKSECVIEIQSDGGSSVQLVVT